MTQYPLFLRNGAWGHIATLPNGIRPAGGRLVFSLSAFDNDVRVDVFADGTISYIAGPHNQQWLSLSGIHFTCE